MARATTAATVQRAKRLRREMSLPEVMLWQILRTRPEGLKFRRQHPIGPYVADFYYPSAKTIIEVDGIVHGMGDRAARDDARDRFLAEKGLRILRIPASEVLGDATEVADAIVALCRGPSTIGSADGPPPRSLRERGG